MVKTALANPGFLSTFLNSSSACLQTIQYMNDTSCVTNQVTFGSLCREIMSVQSIAAKAPARNPCRKLKDCNQNKSRTKCIE